MTMLGPPGSGWWTIVKNCPLFLAWSSRLSRREARDSFRDRRGGRASQLAPLVRISFFFLLLHGSAWEAAYGMVCPCSAVG